MADIITELNLENLSSEEKSEVLSQFTESLLKRLVVRVYNHLDTEDQAVFDKLTEGGNQVQIDEFLKSKIPNLEEIRKEETDGLIEEMKEFMSSAK